MSECERACARVWVHVCEGSLWACVCAFVRVRVSVGGVSRCECLTGVKVSLSVCESVCGCEGECGCAPIVRL